MTFEKQFSMSLNAQWFLLELKLLELSVQIDYRFELATSRLNCNEF